MEILVVIVVLALVLGVGIALVAAYSRNRGEAWRQFAAQHRLQLQEGTLFAPPIISGFFESTAVLLTIEHRGSGNSRQAYTKAQAFFAAQLPAGLKIGKEGFGASLAKLFGGQDLTVGHPPLDDALRIQGQDAEAIAELLHRGRVGQLVLGFVHAEGEALVTQSATTLVVSGWKSDPQVLEHLLRTTSAAVRGIERELRWDPRQAQKHAPAPRKRLDPLPAASPEAATHTATAAATEAAPGEPPPAPPPSAADRMIAGLARDGVQDSAGTFTLDRDVAREKMQEYQLEDPDTYVLELVQSAVRKGASHIALDIDADDMRMSFDGRPFRVADFDHLYASLFAAEPDDDTAARQRLAIGLNAVLGHKPKYVRVTSGDGSAGAELTLKPDTDDQLAALDDSAQLPDGTTIHVKSRLGKALTAGNRRLQETLKTRCQYARIPITLNGEPVAGGPPLPGCFGVVPVRADPVVGHCGFSPSLAGRAEARLVTDGVWISKSSLEDATPGYLAVLEHRGFRKDLSRAELVRDDAWALAIDAAYRAEHDAVSTLSEALLRHRNTLPTAWATAVVKARMRSYNSLDDFRQGGDAAVFARVPAWHTVADTLVSLAHLIRQLDEHGQVAYADYTLAALRWRAAGDLGLDPNQILLLSWRSEPLEAAFLVQLFGTKLRSHTEELLRAVR